MVAGNYDAIASKTNQETSEEDISALVHEEEKTRESEQSLVDSDVFDAQQPAQPIYKSIPLKAAVAAVFAFLLLIPIIGVFSGNLLSGGAKKAETAEAEAVESEAEKARRLAEEENAELKRQLALQNQSFTAEEMEAEAANQEQLASSTAAQKPASAKAAPRRQASSPPARPAPVEAARPVAPARRVTPVRTTARPAPVSRSVQAPQAVAAAPSAISRTQPVTREAAVIEPLDMSRISAAGSYGELPSASIAQLSSSVNPVGLQSDSPFFKSSGTIPVSSRTSPQAVAAIATTLRAAGAEPSTLAEPEGREVKRPMPKVMETETEFVANLAFYEDAEPVADDVAATFTEGADAKEQDTAALPQEKTSYEEDINAVMSAPVFDAAVEAAPINPERLLPGSAAQVSVLNALTWASDLPKALGSIVLSESLNSDGFAVLPAGTEMIVQIDALSESGAIAMNVVAIVLPGNAEAIPLNIPEGAISILDTDGGYPVARAEDSSEALMRRIDRQQAMLGALSGVGNYLNRPERETSVFGVNGSSISREFGAGSIVGAVLSGAANEMLRSRSNRLEDEADEMMDRPTIWSIEKGRNLQIFITQEVAL